MFQGAQSGIMQVIASSFTVADYCEQMRGNGIVVNHDYQRTDKVWPPAARSYLVETMLLGYPWRCPPKLRLPSRYWMRSPGVYCSVSLGLCKVCSMWTVNDLLSRATWPRACRSARMSWFGSCRSARSGAMITGVRPSGRTRYGKWTTRNLTSSCCAKMDR
jgi:hypothetical protein